MKIKNKHIHATVEAAYIYIKYLRQKWNEKYSVILKDEKELLLESKNLNK